MLEIRNLHVQIDDKPILNGHSLTIHDGEVAAVMGPNGSGKSTLSYVIAGKPVYDVTEGEILLDGQNLLELDPDLYSRPAYLGPAGWISLDLAPAETDWSHVADRVGISWRLAAPKRLAGLPGG